jgi:hypothetical protein
MWILSRRINIRFGYVEAMEAMQAELVANGQQLMTSADVVSKVLCLSQGKPPPRQAEKKLF